MSNKDAIKTYSELFKLLENRKVDGNDHFRGSVKLSSDIIEKLNLLVEYELCDTSVDLYQGDKLVSSKGIDALIPAHYLLECKVNIQSHWERGGYYIGANWDELLNSTTRILKPIKQAFFTDTNELTNSTNSYFKNYLKLAKVCGFIDEVALPSNVNGTRTIIFGRDISIIYVLRKRDLNNTLHLDLIDRLLHKDLHHEAKVALVREALVNLLKDIESNKRFGYLISNFNAFSSDLLLSYQGYVERYTFDKVRKEYQEKQTEYIRKVNEAYSDVGAKVLAIPAGLWLAVFKLEEATFGSFGFVKNIIILMLSLLCMFYAIFHFTAQFSILASLKTEYQELFERLASEHDDEASDINKAKARINDSANMTYMKLILSNFATAVVFFMVIILGWFSLT
jgi:hypothetical protein